MTDRSRFLARLVHVSLQPLHLVRRRRRLSPRALPHRVRPPRGSSTPAADYAESRLSRAPARVLCASRFGSLRRRPGAPNDRPTLLLLRSPQPYSRCTIGLAAVSRALAVASRAAARLGRAPDAKPSPTRSSSRVRLRVRACDALPRGRRSRRHSSALLAARLISSAHNRTSILSAGALATP